MIIEFCKDKKMVKKPKRYVQSYIDFFITHEDLWFSRTELETTCGGSNGHARRIVNHLRVEYGMSIVSNRSGYCYTHNKYEIEKCYAELRLRALRALTSARLMKKKLK